MLNNGTLYLIPNLLGADDISIIPEHTREVACGLKEFIVENEKAARRYLIKLGIKNVTAIDDLNFRLIDKHRKKPINPFDFLEGLMQGNDAGIISDAGSPAIADPGEVIVRAAHHCGIKVVPLIGPSSILLALMASGLNGQRFAFHGYLPIDEVQKRKRINQLEQFSRKTGQTQIFMETPYRNMKMLETVVNQCKADTTLCIAANITAPDQLIETRVISKWKGQLPDIHKKPAIFLINAG